MTRPKTSDVVEVYPGSFLLAAKASIDSAGLFAAQGDASGARSPSVLQQIPEEDNGMSLLAFSEVSPLALATYCDALANCQAVLITVQPSLGALLLCPLLREAVAALLGCGCTIRFLGGSPSLPSFARSPPARGASGAWFSAPYNGFLRLQLAGFFLEVPYYKANEPSMLLAEASRAGILRDAEPNQSFLTVIAYHGQKLFEGDTTDVTGDWKRLEDRDQFLAMELQSPRRRGVWLFVGHHFAQVTEGRPDSSASEVHAENSDFQVIVGQVTSPGRLESFTAEGHSSVHFNAMVDSGTFKDGMFEWTLDGEVQRWKVHEMTFNPFVSIAKELDPNEAASDKTPEVGSGYPKGSKVKYWSVTVQRWIPATIVSQNQDGTYRLDVKKRAEPHHLRWPHQAGDLPPTPRPDKAPAKQKKGGQKKARGKAPEVQDTSDTSSSKAKRKRKKKGKDKRSQKKEKTKPPSNSEDSSSRSASTSSEGETSASSSSSLQSSPSLSPKRKASKEKQRKNDKTVKKRTSSSS